MEAMIQLARERHAHYMTSWCHGVAWYMPLKQLQSLVVGYLPLSDPLLWFEEEWLLESMKFCSSSVMEMVYRSSDPMCRASL